MEPARAAPSAGGGLNVWALAGDGAMLGRAHAEQAQAGHLRLGLGLYVLSPSSVSKTLDFFNL